MVLGEHFRGHAEATRPVGFSASPQSPEQAAVVAGACAMHTLGYRDQLHMPCDGSGQLQTHISRGSQGKQQVPGITKYPLAVMGAVAASL